METHMTPTPDGPATPRWVKLFAAVALVTVAVVVIAMLAGGGQHGPGRHTGWSGVSAFMG